MRRFFGIPVPETEAPAPQADVLRAFRHLRPQPSSHPLIRIGDGRDGTYLVPDDLDGIAACFSPGVNNLKTFEDVLTDRHGITCHMCDFTSDVASFRTPLREGKQSFQKKWLDLAGRPDSITLDDWIDTLAPEGDLLLQMDIEGAEYRNILAVSDRNLARFRIIVLELHRLGSMRDAGILDTVIAPFLDKLAAHFVTVHAHPNNAGGAFRIAGAGIDIPHVLELTYIRKDRITAPTIAPTLPHPLDIGRCVRQMPPLILGDAWFDGPRPPAARLKMLEEQMEGLLEFSLPQSARVAAAAVALAGRSLDTMARRLAPAGHAEDLEEVAQGRPFVLGSGVSGHRLHGVVAAQPRGFAQTRGGAGQFIEVDLGALRDIRRIAVSQGPVEKGAMLFAVLYGDDDAGEGATFPIAPRDAAGVECRAELPLTPARRIRIVTPGERPLQLSDLRIHARSH